MTLDGDCATRQPYLRPLQNQHTYWYLHSSIHPSSSLSLPNTHSVSSCLPKVPSPLLNSPHHQQDHYSPKLPSTTTVLLQFLSPSPPYSLIVSLHYHHHSRNISPPPPSPPLSQYLHPPTTTNTSTTTTTTPPPVYSYMLYHPRLQHDIISTALWRVCYYS